MALKKTPTTLYWKIWSAFTRKLSSLIFVAVIEPNEVSVIILTVYISYRFVLA
jgi:hypothetical protein